MKIAFFGDSLTEGIPGVACFDILREKLREHELYNYGRGGDTVLSLYRRIQRLRLPAPFDIAFLWVGTNDILVHISPAYPVVKTLINQPWTRSEKEFADCYHSAVEFLGRKARRVCTVSPLFIGEDLANDWNLRLERLCGIIADLSVERERTDYIDLREVFRPKLDKLEISAYVPGSVATLGLDVLASKDPKQIDARSAERGLHFTMDGVHLNSAGAEIVAEVFRNRIAEVV